MQSKPLLLCACRGWELASHTRPDYSDCCQSPVAPSLLRGLRLPMPMWYLWHVWAPTTGKVRMRGHASHAALALVYPEGGSHSPPSRDSLGQPNPLRGLSGRTRAKLSFYHVSGNA